MTAQKIIEKKIVELLHKRGRLIKLYESPETISDSLEFDITILKSNYDLLEEILKEINEAKK